MPKPSIGAPARDELRASSSSSRPPLAKMVTSREPAVVEDAPHALGERDQIAAVEAHAAHGDAGGLEARRERDDFARRRLGVVGVDQQGQVLAAGRGRNVSNAALSSSCAWTNECAMVPKIGMP